VIERWAGTSERERTKSRAPTSVCRPPSSKAHTPYAPSRTRTARCAQGYLRVRHRSTRSARGGGASRRRRGTGGDKNLRCPHRRERTAEARLPADRRTLAVLGRATPPRSEAAPPRRLAESTRVSLLVSGVKLSVVRHIGRGRDSTASQHTSGFERFCPARNETAAAESQWKITLGSGGGAWGGFGSHATTSLAPAHQHNLGGLRAGCIPLQWFRTRLPPGSPSRPR
jgi:hypothetical protein